MMSNPVVTKDRKRRVWFTFLKHADRDPEATLKVGEEINDYAILNCCVYYKAIAATSSLEMDAFLAWHMVLYPDLSLDTHPAKAFPAGVAYADWRDKPRQGRLAHGRELLSLYRHHHNEKLASNAL